MIPQDEGNIETDDLQKESELAKSLGTVVIEVTRASRVTNRSSYYPRENSKLVNRQQLSEKALKGSPLSHHAR